KLRAGSLRSIRSVVGFIDGLSRRRASSARRLWYRRMAHGGLLDCPGNNMHTRPPEMLRMTLLQSRHHPSHDIRMDAYPRPAGRVPRLDCHYSLASVRHGVGLVVHDVAERIRTHEVISARKLTLNHFS